MKKTCRECKKEKDISEFYKHSEMADGHLNKCIACVKSRISNYRLKNIDYIREYDKRRKKKKNMTAEQILKIKKYAKEYNKQKRFECNSRLIFNSAVKKGIIKKSNKCSDCGIIKNNLSEIEGHHENYYKPLEVIWLCRPCHSKRHNKQ